VENLSGRRERFPTSLFGSVGGRRGAEARTHYWPWPQPSRQLISEILSQKRICRDYDTLISVVCSGQDSGLYIIIVIVGRS
jgi:hypothetical protein